jgi:hypothetical protein
VHSNCFCHSRKLITKIFPPHDGEMRWKLQTPLCDHRGELSRLSKMENDYFWTAEAWDAREMIVRDLWVCSKSWNVSASRGWKFDACEVHVFAITSTRNLICTICEAIKYSENVWWLNLPKEDSIKWLKRCGIVLHVGVERLLVRDGGEVFFCGNLMKLFEGNFNCSRYFKDSGSISH